jgi:hypothetical protein
MFNLSCSELLISNLLKCSPYSVKVNVQCPENARVTLKVDLIFEEYGNSTNRVISTKYHTYANIVYICISMVKLVLMST